MAAVGLIVPDIHERIPLLERILAHYLPRVLWVIFLGDYFDSWTRSDATTRRTIAWLIEALQDKRFELLLGNHDLQYLWPAAHWFRCSGFHPGTLSLVKGLPLDAHWKLRDPRGRIFAHRGGYLLSHAGLHPYHLPREATRKEGLLPWLRGQEELAHIKLSGSRSMRPQTAREFLSPSGSWLWQVGHDRDRNRGATYGGPVWLGWETFTDDPSLPPQIVGHTEGGHPRQKGRSWNLDTQLRHVGLLDNGVLAIEPTRGL